VEQNKHSSLRTSLPKKEKTGDKEIGDNVAVGRQYRRKELKNERDEANSIKESGYPRNGILKPLPIALDQRETGGGEKKDVLKSWNRSKSREGTNLPVGGG